MHASVQVPINELTGMIEWRCHPFWGTKYCPAHEVDQTARCSSCERMQVMYAHSIPCTLVLNPSQNKISHFITSVFCNYPQNCSENLNWPLLVYSFFHHVRAIKSLTQTNSVWYWNVKPRDERYTDVDDVRKLCPQCFDFATMNPNDTESVYCSVREFYARLGLTIEQGISVRLVDTKALKEAAESAVRRA